MHAKLAEAQHVYDLHSSTYTSARREESWQGKMLLDLRTAAGEYAHHRDYLVALQENFKMMATHRKLHDLQFHLEKEYKDLKADHEAQTLEATDKNAQADDIARQRAEQIQSAALRPVRRGRTPRPPVSDDGLSLGLLSRTQSLELRDDDTLERAEEAGQYDHMDSVRSAAGHVAARV